MRVPWTLFATHIRRIAPAHTHRTYWNIRCTALRPTSPACQLTSSRHFHQSDCGRYVCLGACPSLVATYRPDATLPLKTRCVELLLLLRRYATESDGGKEQEVDKPAVGQLKVKVKVKKAFDYNYSGNVFILPVRAMHEYLLTPDDLQKLPKYRRRSAYQYGPPIVLFLRTDVKKRATEVWGSMEKLAEQKKKMQLHEDFTQVQSDVLGIREGASGDEFMDRLAQLSKDAQTNIPTESQLKRFWQSGSGRVVMVAVFVNGINALFKCFAWLFTGSSSMFSEFVHSLADTLNQIVLGLGFYHSLKTPDKAHPYGYQNLRYISSLISGVGIFCFGTGVSWYHGFQSFLHPEPLGPLYWALFTLMGAFISEGASLIVAVNQTKKSAKEKGLSFLDYVYQGHDPNVNVVLLEDCAAVAGVTVAGVCMSLTYFLNHTFADSLGSILIGGLLGGVATFIIYTNTNFLIGQSIPLDMKDNITQSLECDRMIRSLHDVKATMMGGQIRFKAEIDFDGQEITRAYLYKLDLEQLLMEMHNLNNAEEVESFMLKHGTEIIDNLGAEVDRIEKVLKKAYPSLRHVDLEAL